MKMKDEFAYDVFLSHSSNDKTEVADLAARLKADGLRVWFDEWVIQPGDSIPLAIERGLQRSRCLVLLMSSHAFDSDWVTLERHTALFRDPTNKEKRFIPVRLDNAPLNDTLKQFAYIDWRAQEDDQYVRLLAACKHFDADTKDSQNISTVESATPQMSLVSVYAIEEPAPQNSVRVSSHGWLPAAACKEPGYIHPHKASFVSSDCVVRCELDTTRPRISVEAVLARVRQYEPPPANTGGIVHFAWCLSSLVLH